MRVLLAEDNVPLAEELQSELIKQGYAVDWLADGRDVLHHGLNHPLDIAILDLGLPGEDGISILTKWRAEQIVIPVLILTARDHWAERIAGLKAGADDYLTKPFHTEELLLRIQSLIRRSHCTSNQPLLKVNQWALDETTQTIHDGQTSHSLTGAEFSLLRYFMLNTGKVLSKSQLTEHLYDGESDRDSNVIEVHVNHLRSKLGKHIIVTKRGQGYVFLGETA